MHWSECIEMEWMASVWKFQGCWWTDPVFHDVLNFLITCEPLRESHGEILGLSGGCFRSSHRNFASRLRVLLVTCRVALSYSNTLPLMSLPLCHIFDGLFVEQQLFSLIWGNPSFIQQHKTTFKNEYTEEKPFTTDAQMEKMPRHLSTDANRCRARNSLQLETTALQQMSSFHLHAPFIFVTKVNYVICM